MSTTEEPTYVLVKTATGGTRLVDAQTGEDFGLAYQRKVRSPEWKAALIVFHKYKVKYNLDFDDLDRIKDHVISFSEERTVKGKTCSREFLIQTASAFAKTLTHETT